MDPNSAEAHAALGQIKTSYDWDWTGADASFKRALELEPGNAEVVSWASVLSFCLGRFDEAIQLGRRAVELDPLNGKAYSNLASAALSAGQLDETEVAVRKLLELNPDFPSGRQLLGQVYLGRSKPEAALEEMERETDPLWRRFGLALAYHALGRKKEADAALAELIEKDHEEMAYQIAEVHAVRGEAGQAFAWLERAYAQRDSGCSYTKADPLLKSLEADPRYKAFLKKMRLPL